MTSWTAKRIPVTSRSIEFTATSQPRAPAKVNCNLDSRGITVPPHWTLPVGNCWFTRACRRAPPLPPIASQLSVTPEGRGSSFSTHEHRCSRNLMGFYQLGPRAVVNAILTEDAEEDVLPLARGHPL